MTPSLKKAIQDTLRREIADYPYTTAKIAEVCLDAIAASGTHVVVPVDIPDEVLEALGCMDGYGGDDSYDPHSTVMMNADRNHRRWWASAVAMLSASLTHSEGGE